MSSDSFVGEYIGFFDVAVSFQDEMMEQARFISDVCEFHGLRCYYYSEVMLKQCGLDVYYVMSFVYRSTPKILVLNSRMYGKTDATEFELGVIGGRGASIDVAVFDLGGGELRCGSKNWKNYGAVDTSTVLQAVGLTVE